MTTVACVQFAPEFGNSAANSQKMCKFVESVPADIIVFPEAALTGYCADSKEEARSLCRSERDPHLSAIGEACRAQKKHAVVGFCETDGEAMFNSAVFFGPNGRLGIYRKTHLPYLGFDRYATAGDALPLFKTEFGAVGIAICFDNRFPETARSYALRGADLICIPTNWPDSAQPNSEHVCPTRALENRVFIAAANRTGMEKEFWFFGQSVIVSATGSVLARAGDDEQVIVAECDLEISRSKRIIHRRGEYELDLSGARRGDLYGNLNAN